MAASAPFARLRRLRHNARALAPTGRPKTSDEPLRLIDVCSTIDGISSKGSICFIAGAGQGWDFHVISHTWSLDVRKLSETIGKEVGLKAQVDGGTDTYSEGFKQADFSHEPCYKRLIEFLQLLDAEGVKKIWFDALCINQVDNKEKDREIQNMGSYYGRSKGCYVISHGLGEGFKLWGENGALPRWFTRVWTFQEFMLPRQLIFIVEGLDPELIAYVNREINAKSKKGFCRCFLLKELTANGQDSLWGSAEIPFFGPLAGKSGDSMQLAQGGGSSTGSVKETLISCNIDELCVECKSAPMIRKAHIPSYNGAALYLVEREAYIGVMQFGAKFGTSRGKEIAAALEELCSLYTMLTRHRFTWPLRYTIAEVRNRQCSVEEDRVLAILALLGVKLSQVRSGKGLQIQLVELAKVCTIEMLTELFMMDTMPCSTVGMSWAPNFTAMGHIAARDNSWHTYNRGHCGNLDVDLKKLHVSDIGSIQISTGVVSGLVLPITALPIALVKTNPKFSECYIDGYRPPTHFIVVPVLQSSYNPSNLAFEQLATPLTPNSLSYISMELCSFLPLDLCITKISTSCGSINFLLNFQLNWRAKETHVGHFDLPIIISNNTRDFKELEMSLDLKQLEVSFPVKMVVLGNGEGIECSQFLTSTLIMVCLYKTNEDGGEEELHKIGMLALREQTKQYDGDVNIEIFNKSSKSKCLIGGFGPDLNNHVKIEHGKKVHYVFNYLKAHRFFFNEK